MPTYQTRNSKAVHTPVRSLPMFPPAATVFRASRRTVYLQGELARLLNLRLGAQQAYTAAYVALGKANATAPAYRAANKRDAFCRINQVRAAARKVERDILAMQAALLDDGMPMAGGVV